MKGQPSEAEITSASVEDLGIVRTLWREYWNFLNLPEDFQGFGDELRTLPGLYADPEGRLLLARVEGRPAGTIGLRPLNGRACEGKRLYVRPEFRSKRIGQALLTVLIEEARAIGYREIYGDTLPSMGSALALYRKFGFSEVGPYSSHPTPGAIYLRLILKVS